MAKDFENASRRLWKERHPDLTMPAWGAGLHFHHVPRFLMREVLRPLRADRRAQELQRGDRATFQRHLDDGGGWERVAELGALAAEYHRAAWAAFRAQPQELQPARSRQDVSEKACTDVGRVYTDSLRAGAGWDPVAARPALEALRRRYQKTEIDRAERGELWEPERFRDVFAAEYDRLWEARDRPGHARSDPATLQLGTGEQPCLVGGGGLTGTDRSVYSRYRHLRSVSAVGTLESRAARLGVPVERHMTLRLRGGLAATEAPARREAERAVQPLGLTQARHRGLLRSLHSGLTQSDMDARVDRRRSPGHRAEDRPVLGAKPEAGRAPLKGWAASTPVLPADVDEELVDAVRQHANRWAADEDLPLALDGVVRRIGSGSWTVLAERKALRHAWQQLLNLEQEWDDLALPPAELPALLAGMLSTHLYDMLMSPPTSSTPPVPDADEFEARLAVSVALVAEHGGPEALRALRPGQPDRVELYERLVGHHAGGEPAPLSAEDFLRWVDENGAPDPERPDDEGEV